MAEIIAICNQKGGIGKTTSVINIGAVLAKPKDKGGLGKKVLIIDLDPSRNVTQFFRFDEENDDNPTITDLFEMCISDTYSVSDEALAKSIRHNDTNNIDYIPADINVSMLYRQLTKTLQPHMVLKQIVTNKILSDYDYILIDNASAFDDVMFNILAAANYLLIAVQTELFSYNGIDGTFQFFNLVTKRGLNPELKILGILPTMYGNNNVSKRTLETLKENHPKLLFKSIISETKEVSMSVETGKALCYFSKHYKKANKIGQEYSDATKELVRRIRTLNKN